MRGNGWGLPAEAASVSLMKREPLPSATAISSSILSSPLSRSGISPEEGCGAGSAVRELASSPAGLRTATVEDVLHAVEAMRVKEDGSPVKPATVNTYVASVKSFLGFAHRVGYTRFNAGPPTLRFHQGAQGCRSRSLAGCGER
jgi:hypothetical protein